MGVAGPHANRGGIGRHTQQRPREERKRPESLSAPRASRRIFAAGPKCKKSVAMPTSFSGSIEPMTSYGKNCKNPM
jgi:hypothetical protein